MHVTKKSSRYFMAIALLGDTEKQDNQLQPFINSLQDKGLQLSWRQQPNWKYYL
ncbi:MAG: hypothetical protein DSM106950_35960 [Stigonema ocellatum SAG 48.90 = DSM 106950]|nr:hypothetical protein [Stigonema ocellatum SAG 48.90 = DSM 106950]